MTCAGPIAVVLIDGRQWIVDRPIVCVSNAGREYTVPAGFETDFASSWIGPIDLLPLKATYGYPPILHDYLYSTGILKRVEADMLFLEGLLSIGVGKWFAYKAYFGVRLFGGFAWREHARNREIRARSQA